MQQYCVKVAKDILQRDSIKEHIAKEMLQRVKDYNIAKGKMQQRGHCYCVKVVKG